MDSLWDFPDFDEHELVHFVTDRESGLKAVIAVHSSHLGPGAGAPGCGIMPRPAMRSPTRSGCRAA